MVKILLYILNSTQIGQLDGAVAVDNISITSDDMNSTDKSESTDYATDDEIEPQTTPICLTPTEKLNKRKMKVL